MSKSGACRAFWLVPITFELPLPTYHTGYTLWLCCSCLFHCSVIRILISRRSRIVRLELWLPREIVEVAVVIVDGIESHCRMELGRVTRLRELEGT